MASSVEKRIEDERFLAAFGGSGRRIGSGARIEHAGPARRGQVIGIGLRRGGGLRRGVRRQIERTLAAAAPEREHGHAEHYDGPSRRCWAVVAIHDKIPNAGGTIQRLPRSGETWTAMKL